MDAQNAVKSTSAKQPASPTRGGDTETTQPRTRSPAVSKTALSTIKDTKLAAAVPLSALDEDAAHERDSDAETIVLSGKDGISPSKPRKVIKHEDKSDGEIDDDILPAPKMLSRDGRDSGVDGDRTAAPAEDSASSLGKKRRPLDKQRVRDGSAALSSAPPSPPSHHQEQSSLHRRQRSGDAGSGSDSEISKPRSPKPPKDSAKSIDRLLSQKRKAPKAESDDEVESRKVRRPRISETSLDGKITKDHKFSSGKLHPDRPSSSRPRSNSPHGRAHRRSLSTQLPDKSTSLGFASKKRRIPAPLQSTDYHSDDSSAGGSPYPRSSRLKSIVTPGTGDSTMSPAKMAPHKKHLDAHGQTLFAKACAKGEYDVAKTRLAERPEDLNFADHAGNTPLQVASLNGHEDVVELLIGAGCNLECRNDVKDTPLLDAVENGHLGVVKLLLAAGVNPRKANAEGQEPMELVTDDLDNAEEIKQTLREAKQKVGELRRTSEDHLPLDTQDSSSHGANSPRRSPDPSISAVLAASSRRGGTVRSTKTSNHLLYMSLDEKTLRQAAARGDQETVTRVLQVKESCDDAEALVAAARGGHNFVMELLLALGGANPDPSPVPSLPSEHSTPMLAAIGQENIKVVQLLLEQSGFDPTRRFRGETYYEIARRREGSMWKEEEHLLKNAYDEYKKAHRGHSKAKLSPSRREKELAQEAKRSARGESNQDKPRLQHKRRPSSPPKDPEPKKKPSSKAAGSPKEKKRSQSFGQNDDQVSPRRGRPKKDEKVPAIAISDREASPALSTKPPPGKPKRTESDIAGSSEGEAAKPRRKLISGKDLKGQREKQRRSSIVSNNSAKDMPERSDSKSEDAAEKHRVERITEKYHDRTKALKRDDSRDRLSPHDTSGKRHRASMTPPRVGTDDKEDGEVPIKRRKLDAEGKENRNLKTSSEDRPRKRDVSNDPAKRLKTLESDRKDVLKPKKLNRDRKEGEKANSTEKASITVASEDVDMRDAPESASVEDREALSEKERADSKKRQSELEAAAAEESRKKAEAKQREVEERQKREAEDKRLQEEAEQKRIEEEEKQRREEAEKRRQEEEKLRLEAEQQKREEEERKRMEEEEEEEERKKKEDEERMRRDEEERSRREKEAAEEARRLREEDERKERERKRAAREAEALRLRQEQEREQERLRLSRLPPLLRWLDGSYDAKQKKYAELFATMQGVRYDTINPQAAGTQGREQWLLNTQVALLLGEKDLTLQRYTGWERIPVSSIAKRVIWRLEQDRYALTESKLYHLGEQLSDYYGGEPSKVGYRRLEKLRGDASRLFFEMDMFFVKETDLLFVLPSIPHLRNVKLSICYRELPEHENQLNVWTAPAKWKSDPDASTREGFAPRHKYYINGRLEREDRPGHYKPSSSPFPDQRVPRRGGLVAVGPEEPDFPQLCLEQGLGHLLSEQQKLMAMNTAHLTPRSMTSNNTDDGTNGETLSPTAVSPATRVNGIYDADGVDKPFLNGINGTMH